jgi:glycosyltransferase involved in cell wall biosynthesis
MGVRTPYAVIPQGVTFGDLRPEQVEKAARLRRPDEVVVGYVAAWLLTSEDRDGANTLYNVDHLLDLWDAIHAEIPTARLWLVGQPSDSVRRRCHDRADILVLGRLPQQEAHACVSNFDIALYPRRVDQGVFAVKVAEYIGLGVPTVSYDLDVTRMLVESDAGIQVQTPGEFVDAVTGLARDDSRRRQHADAARRAGRALDMDLLAERYEQEVFGRYLPVLG